MLAKCRETNKCRWRYSRIENVVLVPALLDGIVSTVFWLWALIDVASGHAELGGSFTFAIAIAAAVVGIVAVHKTADRPLQLKLALAYYIGAPTAHLAVTLDYATASFIYTDATTIMYSIFGASFWLVTGGFYGFWARAYYLHVRAVAGDATGMPSSEGAYDHLL